MKKQVSHQALSRRGINDAFVYIIILLIALFSGLIVYFMANSLINDYILRTIGLRLTLHGLTVYYNTIYTMPPGVTYFESSLPSMCTEKCIDCSYYFWFNLIPVPITYCDCTNGFLEGDVNKDGVLDPSEKDNNLLDQTVPDQTGIVCGDYLIDAINPVMLFSRRDPVAGGVRIDLRIHPESSLYTSFNDLVSLTGTTSDFFRNEITVFSEAPVNLNDYLGTRYLITSPFGINNFVSWYGNSNPVKNTVSIEKTTFDNFESLIGNSASRIGLQGLLNYVFDSASNTTFNNRKEDANFCDGVNDPVEGCTNGEFYCSNGKVVINEEDCFCLKSYDAIKCNGVDDPVVGCSLGYYACGDGSFNLDETLCPGNGVICPGPDGVSYDLIIKPGLKLVANGQEICEYECYSQNSLEPNCPLDDWHEVGCFDFSELSKIDCPGCAADDISFSIDTCGGECVGGAYIDYPKLKYTDVTTGAEVFSGNGDFSITLQPAYRGVCTQDYFTSESGGGSISDYERLVKEINNVCTNIKAGDSLSTDCLNSWYNIEYCDDHSSASDCSDPRDYLNCDTIKADTTSDSGSVPWQGSDCELMIECDQSEPDVFKVIVKSRNNPTDYDSTCGSHYEYIPNKVCDVGDGILIKDFMGCDSEGIYEFNVNDDTLSINLEDTASKSSFKSILTANNLMRETYKLILDGSCADSDFSVGFESLATSDVFSKMVKGPSDSIVDKSFKLILKNPSSSKMSIKVEEEVS